MRRKAKNSRWVYACLCDWAGHWYKMADRSNLGWRPESQMYRFIVEGPTPGTMPARSSVPRVEFMGLWQKATHLAVLGLPAPHRAVIGKRFFGIGQWHDWAGQLGLSEKKFRERLDEAYQQIGTRLEREAARQYSEYT